MGVRGKATASDVPGLQSGSGGDPGLEHAAPRGSARIAAAPARQARAPAPADSQAAPRGSARIAAAPARQARAPAAPADSQRKAAAPAHRAGVGSVLAVGQRPQAKASSDQMLGRPPDAEEEPSVERHTQVACGHPPLTRGQRRAAREGNKRKATSPTEAASSIRGKKKIKRLQGAPDGGQDGGEEDGAQVGARGVALEERGEGGQVGSKSGEEGEERRESEGQVGSKFGCEGEERKFGSEGEERRDSGQWDGKARAGGGERAECGRGRAHRGGVDEGLDDQQGHQPANPLSIPVASTELRFSTAAWAVKARKGMQSIAPPPTGTPIRSPLNWEAIAADLGPEYPDQALIAAVRDGCPMMYTGPDVSSAAPNHSSAMEVAEEITEQIKEELEKGVIGGGFQSVEDLKAHLGVEHVRIQPLGATSKRGSTKKRRFDDGSFGDGVNSGIEDLPSLKFTTVDLMARDIAGLKERFPVVTVAKTDVASAFRCVPVLPACYHLMCFQWDSGDGPRYYYHRMLSFGLRSSPSWYQRLSLALMWALAPLLPPGTAAHAYLDDNCMYGDAERMPEAMLALRALMKRWGLPLNEIKFEKEGKPEVVKVVLGVIIDTEKQELRLEEERLQDIHTELQQWSGQKYCSKKKLQSLIGVLSFACKCIQPGRLFLRRLITTLKVGNRKAKAGRRARGGKGRRQGRARGIKLDKEFHKDLDWWRLNMEGFNGTTFLPSNHPSRRAQINFASDASSSFGYGAVLEHRFIWGKWSEKELAMAQGHRSIGVMELSTVVFAIAAFAPHLRGKRVRCWVDNRADVDIFNGQASKEAKYNELLRLLHTLLVQHEIQLTARHIAGVDNVLPDALSRGELKKFIDLSPFPCAQLQACQVPPTIRACLMPALRSN